ncbi:MAG: MFS transporter [Legionellales bacterium]
MGINQLDLLKTRRFLPLFITQFLGAFNDNVFKNALVILITYRIAASYGMNPQILVTVVAGLFILPFFLFSATAGQLADKYEKSRLISIIKFAEIIIMLLATSGFYLHNTLVLLTVLFFLGIQATFFGPLKYAMLPSQLHEEELIAGNGLIEAGTFIAILLGTILGGLLILLPFGVALISTAICLFAVLGFITSLYIPNTHTAYLEQSISYNFIKETIRVVHYAKKQPDLMLPILAISWFWLIGAVYLAEFPVFAKDILHADALVVTFFIALFSIGIALGSVLCNKLLDGKVQTTFVPLGALGMSLFAVDLYFAAGNANMIGLPELITPYQLLQTLTGWRIVVDLLFIAICGGLYTVPLYALLQKRSDKSHRARVIAANNIINALFMVLAAAATVLMLKMGYTVKDVFLYIAIINGAVTLFIYLNHAKVGVKT